MMFLKHKVDLILSSWIGAAPAVLDTTVEIATELGHDRNVATTVQNQSNNKAAKGSTYSKSDVDVFYLSYKLVYITVC